MPSIADYQRQIRVESERLTQRREFAQNDPLNWEARIGRCVGVANFFLMTRGWAKVLPKSYGLHFFSNEAPGRDMVQEERYALLTSGRIFLVARTVMSASELKNDRSAANERLHAQVGQTGRGAQPTIEDYRRAATILAQAPGG